MARKKELDQLTRDVLEAEKAGMTYGKWKAMQSHRKPEPKTNPESDRRCKVCGKAIPLGSRRSTFCSDECKMQWDYKKNRAYYQKEGER